VSKTVLVAGGAGFLGSHLSARLCAEGYHVIAIDNLSSGNYNNVASLQNNHRFDFIEHDIVKPLDVRADIILNFACPASPPRYQSDPIQTLKTSVLGTLNLLELAKKYDAMLLQASTSEVYGCPHEHPQRETYWGNVNPIGIRSCYDEGKRAAETACVDFMRQHNVHTKIIRIFNTYGPHMDPLDGRVVSNFIVRALANEPLEMYGDGSATRSFCYVDDLIEGIMRFMHTPQSCTGPINLGNPAEFTLHQLATEIIRLTESSVSVVHKSRPSDDPERRRPDITKAQELLSWEPKIGLTEGLTRTIAYFKTLMTKDTAQQKHEASL
jgi:UDP-glucuronate decarboxylase